MTKLFQYHYNRIYDCIVDNFFHVETSKCAKLDEHDNIMNFMYEPTPYLQLRKVFKEYPICQNDYLIDIGCGKGRVLVMAAEFGCRNLYGLDISSYLLEIAKHNLTQCKKRHNNMNFELLCMNAKTYTFDPRINKIFFYNPFQLKVFIYIFKALIRSIDENPREVTVYFCGAKKSIIDYFEKMGYFKLLGRDEKNGVYIYSHPSNKY